MTGNVSQFGTLNIHQSMTAEAIMAMQMNHNGQQDGASISMPIPSTILEQKRGAKQISKERANEISRRRNKKRRAAASGLSRTKVYVSRSPQLRFIGSRCWMKRARNDESQRRAGAKREPDVRCASGSAARLPDQDSIPVPVRVVDQIRNLRRRSCCQPCRRSHWRWCPER